MPSENVITVMGNPVTIHRLSLYGWSKLEGLKKAMDEAISHGDIDQYCVHIVHFIEMASPDLNINWDEVPWYETIQAFSEVILLNSPTLDFPVLIQKAKEEKKLPWEYDGRAWYFWLNLFASNYGWGKSDIAGLDIDEAIGLYQEILLEEQLEKEWQWGLSEIAYPYKESTKKQEFSPLTRPEWMLPMAPTELPIIKMRRDMLPVGNIIDLDAEERKRKEAIRGI